MTLAVRLDSDDASTGASNLEIARVLIDHGAQTDADLRELWSRIVFNMLISSTDDHPTCAITASFLFPAGAAPVG